MSNLQPGQHVLIRPARRSKGFRMRATVVRVSDCSVVVAERWKGEKSGGIIEIEKRYRPERIDPTGW